MARAVINDAEVKGNVWLKFYDYTTSFTITASSLVQNQQIITDSQSTFQWEVGVASLYNTATGLPVTAGNNLLGLQGTVQITDGASNYPLFSQPEDLNCVFGTAQKPMVLPVPYNFLPGSSFNVAINVAAASIPSGDTYLLNLVFRGMKKYLAVGQNPPVAASRG
jgi:hypothetical protein